MEDDDCELGEIGKRERERSIFLNMKCYCV